MRSRKSSLESVIICEHSLKSFDLDLFVFFAGGVLLVIPNYTGDCLNFGLAMEWAKRDGTQVCVFVFSHLFISLNISNFIIDDA